MHADFAFLYTHNVVDGPLAQVSVKAHRRLPETPAFAGNAGLSYRWLRGDNLADASANRFALGNPTILATRQQTTPLRPRNLRFGVSIAW
ncbi:MAG: hypothetical protein WCS75_14950 [Sphingomonas sp.]|uniref:hypothetical protein n=1 Tax=Sphingomonas sp. TaxID=28214 RepID=UPI00356A078B